MKRPTCSWWPAWSPTKAIRRESVEAKEAIVEAYYFVRRHDWKGTIKRAFQRKYWGWWAAFVFVIALSTVLSAFHNQIAQAIFPYQHAIKHSKWAWCLPLLLLIIVSFPPLFGHELICLILGLIWGLEIGFAIAAAGTFFGELATYAAFKYLFRQRAFRLERENVLYACLAQLMRDGGLPMLILVRFSAMPGHVTTAIQSCIGIGVSKYAIACFLTLPKQFSLVYLGKIFGDTAKRGTPDWNDPGQQGENLQQYYDKKNRKISLIVFALTTFATIIAAYIVWIRARRIRPLVLADMDARRRAEALESGDGEMAELDVSLSNSDVKPEYKMLLKPRPATIHLGAGTSLSTLDLASTLGLSTTTSLLGLPRLPYEGVDGGDGERWTRPDASTDSIASVDDRYKLKRRTSAPA